MKKKVCIFTSYFPLVQGGAEYQAYLLAQSLAQQNFEVFFLSFNQGKRELIEKDGYKIYSITTHNLLSKAGNPYFLYYYKIKEILSKEKPDIVYRRMGSAIPGILCLLQKKLNFKLLWACAHIRDVEKFKISGLKNILNNVDNIFRIYGINHADKILVQTNVQRQLLLKNFRRDASIFPNLHPINHIQITKKISPIQILWIANFKDWKQPECFIDLAGKFQDYPHVKFIMVGRSNSSKSWFRIKEKINALKQLEHRGELPMKEVNQLLEDSHIFVNTSLSEGFPNTFIQAWMRKVPVISLHVDPDDMIKKNKIGFHSNTFSRLVADTKILIEQHERREIMGELAQRYAVETFSLHKMGKLINLFQSI